MLDANLCLILIGVHFGHQLGHRPLRALEFLAQLLDLHQLLVLLQLLVALQRGGQTARHLGGRHTGVVQLLFGVLGGRLLCGGSGGGSSYKIVVRFGNQGRKSNQSRD